MGENNFIIRGSELSQLQAQLALMGLIRDTASDGLPTGGETPEGDLPGEVEDVASDLLDILNTDFQISQPGLEDAGRLHVDGYPAVLVQDTLYSLQADPSDPPITTPPAGSGTREDTVYLDVWEEPVTFVEDPDIREIALGGPDTSTRRRLRQCVRVAQGGPMPSGDGRGHGLLATEGAYTGRDNRLFRIEIEDAGELGAATFRWSDENASTIARVTRTIASGSRTIVVEDGTAFLARDFILIRCGFREEHARIASVLDDVITSTNRSQTRTTSPTARGSSAGTRSRCRSPSTTSTRWSRRRSRSRMACSSASAAATSAAATTGRSAPRYLARDQSAGVDPNTRIEDLGFVRPHGVKHHYAPLAKVTRNEHDDGRITSIKDERRRVGNATVTDIGLPPSPGSRPSTRTSPRSSTSAGRCCRPRARRASTSSSSPGRSTSPARSRVRATRRCRSGSRSHNAKRTNPATEPDVGRIQDSERGLPLARIEALREVPVHVTFVSSGTPFAFVPVEDFTPLSAEVFAQVKGTGFSVELSNLRLTAVELKKTT